MKFGTSQIGKPAPKWVERLMNALIVIVMPALGVLVLAIPNTWVSPEAKNFIGACGTFTVAILKGVLFFIGDDEKTEQLNS